MKLPARAKDITGQKFGRLTVVAYSHYRHRARRAMWTCRCDCGTTITTAGTTLRYGHAQSCGCLRLERSVAASHARAKTPPVLA